MLYITPSLYSAWHWYTNASAEKEQQAKLDFENALYKIKTPPTETMQAGIDFENKIRKLTEQQAEQSTVDDCEQIDITISKLLQYSRWQLPIIEKTIQLPSILIQDERFNEISFKGITDAIDIRNGIIYDLKKTSSFYIGKYNYSIQHLVYMYCSGLYKFRYIVRIPNQTELLTDDYFLTPDQVETELRDKVTLFIYSILQNKDWAETLFSKWQM